MAGESLPTIHTPNVGLTYYVDGNAGSDSNGGTSISDAWATLQKAADYLKATATWPTNQDVRVYVRNSNGTTVYQAASTQADTLITSYDNVNRQPHSSRWVIWERYPGDAKPIVKPPAGTNSNKIAIQFYTSGSSFVSDFQSIRGFVIDGENTRRNGSTATTDETTAGIYFANDAGNCEAVSCDVFGLQATGNAGTFGKAQGIYSEGTGGPIYITGCHVYDIGTTTATRDTQEHGIYVGGDGHRIWGNVVHDCPNGYNVQIFGSTPTDILIASNTLSTCEKSNIVVPRNGTDIVIKNNILHAGGQYNIEFFPTTNAGATNIIDNNVMNGAGIDTLSHATSASWTITDTVTGDPAFVNYGSRDLHIGSTSSAIGHGDSAYATVSDFDNVTRDESPDAGAYEYFSGAIALGTATSAKGTLEIVTTVPLDGEVPTATSAKATAILAIALATKAATSSSAKASLSVARPLAADADTATSAKATPRVAWALVADADVATQAKATPTVLRRIDSKAATASSATASARMAWALAAKAQTASSASGTLSVLRTIAAAAPTSSGAKAEPLRLALPLAAKSPSTSWAHATQLTNVLEVAAKAGSASSAKATASVTRGLVAEADTAASARASVSLALPLSAKAAASLSATGSLSVAIALSAKAPSASEAKASTSVLRLLQGSAPTASGAKALAEGAVQLLAVANAATSAKASLGVLRTLAAAAPTSSSTTAALRASWALAGSVPTAANVPATLLHLLRGVSSKAAGATSAKGSLTLAVGLSAKAAVSTSASATLPEGGTVAIAAKAASATSARGSLGVAFAVSGRANTSSSAWSPTAGLLRPLAAKSPTASGASAPQVLVTRGLAGSAPTSSGSRAATVQLARPLAAKAPTAAGGVGFLQLQDVTIYGYVMRASGLQPITEAYVMTAGGLVQLDDPIGHVMTDEGLEALGT